AARPTGTAASRARRSCAHARAPCGRCRWGSGSRTRPPAPTRPATLARSSPGRSAPWVSRCLSSVAAPETKKPLTRERPAGSRVGRPAAVVPALAKKQGASHGLQYSERSDRAEDLVRLLRGERPHRLARVVALLGDGQDDPRGDLVVGRLEQQHDV